MAGPSSRVDDSAQHISDVGDDFFNSLLNMSPYYERLPELNITPQPQNEAPLENQEGQQEILPENQEEQQENTDQPPVEVQATGSSRISNRRIASREPLTIERLSSLYHLTEKQAAKEAGWGLATFRKQRQALGVEHWPYRKMKSVTLAVNKLQELKETSKRINQGMLDNYIPMMENIRQRLIDDPNLTLDVEANKARRVAQSAIDRQNRKERKIREQHQS